MPTAPDLSIPILAELVEQEDRKHVSRPAGRPPLRRIVVRVEAENVQAIDALRKRAPFKGRKSRSRGAMIRAFIVYSLAIAKGLPDVPPEASAAVAGGGAEPTDEGPAPVPSPPPTSTPSTPGGKP